METKKIDLGLTGYDKLFMSSEERKEVHLPKIQDIPISEIDDFPDHPFQVRLEADIEELVQSVSDWDIITPIILSIILIFGMFATISSHRFSQLRICF